MRLARHDDIPTLVALMTAFYAESALALDAARAGSSFERLLDEPVLGAAWLIEADDEAAGYIVLTLAFSMECGGASAFIDDLFVRPGFRRRGLARRALEMVLDECRVRRVHAVHLEVGRENDPARRLYERYGFRPTDRELLTARL